MRLRGFGINATTRPWFLVVSVLDYSRSAHGAVLYFLRGLTE
jgi:hypothetical protein